MGAVLLVRVVGVESLHSGSSRRSALWILLGQVYRGRWSFLSKCPAKVPHAPSDCLPPDAMECLLQHRGDDLRLVRSLGSQVQCIYWTLLVWPQWLRHRRNGWLPFAKFTTAMPHEWSSPKTAVVEVPQEGDCLLDSLMVLEWEAESPQAHMKLTLRYEDDDSTWWVVAFEKACQEWSKRVRIYHFWEAGRARYTYFDGDNAEMDLPAGVYESMVPRNRIRVTAGSVRSEPVFAPRGWVYCGDCFKWLNSKPQWYDHSEGKKHTAREKICKFLT